MKTRALLVALFVAGVMSSLALGASAHHREGVTTSTVTTTTEHHACHKVLLAGAATGGSVAFKATQASKAGKTLAGSAVAVTIPAGAHVHVTACMGTNGAFTLRSLVVSAPRDEPKHEHDGEHHDK